MVPFRCPFDKTIYNCICLTATILLVCYYANFYWIHKDMTIYVVPTPINFWYLQGGDVYPLPTKKSTPLFQNGSGDRILEQLTYVPEQYKGENATPKIILIHSWNNILGVGGSIKEGSVNFKGCPVSRCFTTTNKTMGPIADAIIFKNTYVDSNFTRPLRQVWILFYSERPTGTIPVPLTDVFNWTATYRSDSDIVVPYGFWNYYDKNVKFKPVENNYAAKKEKKVAWIVSNCNSSNNRKEYAKELSKYIQVDIYGKCGSLECPQENGDSCNKMVAREYKFYLAFENNNCRDYITEKYFANSLGNSVIPVVMGASREDFDQFAPQGSYIHVDDFASPKHLADYLHMVDKNEDLYNSYFEWVGAGELIGRPTFFYCRLCAMLHGPIVPKQYEDVNKWWRPQNICAYD